MPTSSTYSIGSDEILKKMNRKHNLKEYLETINYLREKIQNRIC